MISFGRYVLSAGAASAVDFALVQSLLLAAFFQSGWPFGIAVALGALAGMSVNFVLSRRFVFQRDDRHAVAQLRSFILISLTTLLLRILVAYLAIAVLSLPLFGWLSALPIDAPATRLSHIAAMGIVTIYSYFAHKHISFAGGLAFWLSRRLAVR
jgi:putative flippase GtrA